MGNLSDPNFMVKNSAFSPYRLQRREIGLLPSIGGNDALECSLYCGMKPIAAWDGNQSNDLLPTGGVFNLEFSPEGNLLVAACEKRSIQIFDPLTHQRVHCVNGAHSDCVNCVKFLDGRMFATCSDDTTIAIWDVRNLKKKIRSLAGHLKWVKNIEFSVKDKLLVTSALDGSIYTWDINSYTENNLLYREVFHTSSLMRCRLSPDAKQMVMCTTGGLLIIVHDLNLHTLMQDFKGFKPNLYHLMQMSKQVIPAAALYDHIFNTKRKENRVEFVSDFPEGNDAEVVSALQIHPQGWCALSRNISHEDRSEWTCIHDIQPLEPYSEKSCRDTSLKRSKSGRRSRYAPTRISICEDDDQGPDTYYPDMWPTITWRRRPLLGSRADATSGRQYPAIQNDIWEASVTIKQQRLLQELYSRGQVRRNFNMQRIIGINSGIDPPPPTHVPTLASTAAAASGASSTPHLPTHPVPTAAMSYAPSTSGRIPSPTTRANLEERGRNFVIRQNKDRLLYYIEETNKGKGFIKELCYSADGRLVCSPFARGMRLLALDDRCRELPHCVQELTEPRPMVEVGQCVGIHRDLVVSSRFSPRYHMLVTGCLDGKIVWYTPYSGETPY